VDADTTNDGNDITGTKLRAKIRSTKSDPSVNGGAPIARWYEWRVAPRNLLYEAALAWRQAQGEEDKEDKEEEKGPDQRDYMLAMMADQIASLQSQMTNSEVRKEVIRDKDGLIKEIVERRVAKS
jgi:hypothetical protein